MLARSGLVGKKSSRPYLGPSDAIFSIDQKIQKNVEFLPIFHLGQTVCTASELAPKLAGTCKEHPSPLASDEYIHSMKVDSSTGCMLEQNRF